MVAIKIAVWYNGVMVRTAEVIRTKTGMTTGIAAIATGVKAKQ